LTPVFFADAASFRAWLAKHAKAAGDLIVGFHKVGKGKPSMTWPQSVDEALCVGWIDGVRKRIDDESYLIRFSPRRPGSIWSAINIARVQALAAEGRMTKEGIAAFERRIERKSRIYAYEREHPPELDAHELRQFQRNEAAWAFLDNAAPWYRRNTLHWITSAKQPATRARRLAMAIEKSAAWEQLLR
jgi:uncharacterized protein YdeI (YjbR/CyaY-like superfamily)